MAADPHAEARLNKAFRDHQMLQVFLKLAEQRPDIVQRLLTDANSDGIANDLQQHNRVLYDRIKQVLASAKPAKSAAKPGRRPGFDENGSTTAAVKAILRSR